jgi:hypothetical protein
VFHFIHIIHLNRSVPAVYVDDQGNGNGCLGSRYGYDEERKKMPLQLIRVQIPVKNNKIDVDRIQYQFNRHEHGDEVSPCKKPKNANKKYQRAYDQKVSDGDALDH